MYSVNDKVSNATLALKVMKKTDRPAFDIELVVAEQKVLKKTKAFPWFLSLEASFHDTVNFYFLMVCPRVLCLCRSSRLFYSSCATCQPLYPSDLESEIFRCGRFGIPRARFYMCELVRLLHEVTICNTDNTLSS